jgi:uncharacterized membrane protein
MNAQMSNRKMIVNAISTVLALGLTGTSTTLSANQEPGQQMMQESALPGMEKCFGIAKAGANDCGNASHNCSGEAKRNNDKNEWLYVPNGLCKKIVGGSTTPPKNSASS